MGYGRQALARALAGKLLFAMNLDSIASKSLFYQLWNGSSRVSNTGRAPCAMKLSL
jgi:hypothetical protein